MGGKEIAENKMQKKRDVSVRTNIDENATKS